jgi:1-acyl-sn-glycerol-3-phosphate acyltransferase
MAIESGQPLLPLMVWGGHRIWTTGRKPRLKRHLPIFIKVGAPIDINGIDDANVVTDLLYERLTMLAEEVQRAYPAPETDEERWWQPAYLGGTAPTLTEAMPIEAAAIEARRRRKQRKQGKPETEGAA